MSLSDAVADHATVPSGLELSEIARQYDTTELLLPTVIAVKTNMSACLRERKPCGVLFKQDQFTLHATSTVRNLDKFSLPGQADPETINTRTGHAYLSTLAALTTATVLGSTLSYRDKAKVSADRIASLPLLKPCHVAQS